MQKAYKTRPDWVGKAIQWELCKKFQFDHTNKLYMYKPELVQENETHKILWDFEVQTNHRIQARRLHLVLINKKKYLSSGVFSSSNKPEWKQRKTYKYSDLSRDLKKTAEHGRDGDANSSWLA